VCSSPLRPLNLINVETLPNLEVATVLIWRHAFHPQECAVMNPKPPCYLCLFCSVISEDDIDVIAAVMSALPGIVWKASPGTGRAFCFFCVCLLASYTRCPCSHIVDACSWTCACTEYCTSKCTVLVCPLSVLRLKGALLSRASLRPFLD
jgi:hypothetical protein